jgi:xylulokinase
MALFVGCDLGTMGTKAAVVDDAGEIRGFAFEEVELHYPRPGWVEQRLEDIESSAYRTIRAALTEAGTPRAVAGVAFSGQMSGIGSIDHSFNPATPYDSWLDSRCAPYIVQMEENAARVTELSGCPPTYSHGPKIMWWQRERPDVFKRIARFVVPGGYVAGRLCELKSDDAFVDRTYIHFSNLSDTRAAQWSTELLEAFGVEERVLPRIVDPLDIVGQVTPRGEDASGIPAGTPVAAGAGDQTAASLGAGVVEPGQAFDSAGTASVFAMCLNSFAPDVRGKSLMATHSVINGTYIALAFINGGGLALRWFRDEVTPELARDAKAYARLDDLAREVDAGSGGLLWWPHFQGRVLPPHPHSRGGWLGLTAGHTRAHMYRAVLEGIAYEYAEWARLATEAAGEIELHEARVLGGGAASSLWNSIKADVLGIDWVPTVRVECGVLGDGLIAAAATGHVNDLAQTARAWQDTQEPVHPDAHRNRVYARYLEAYRRLGDASDPVFDALRSATE